MRMIKLLWIAVVLLFVFVSCTADVEDSENRNTSIPLPELLESYDLWYVDYDATTGSGDVPFLTRAFTISFLGGNVYANNNLAGIGTTGGGLGVRVGYCDYFSNTVRVYHSIYGVYDLEVYQQAPNRIKVYNRSENVSYYLIGYQRSGFDYDRLFMDNIHYFLQEYKAWEKVYTSRTGALNDFDNEHFIQFVAGGNGTSFRSSQDAMGTSVNAIFWDFIGVYGIVNTSNPYVKNLTLDYDFWGNESFVLSVITDNRIRLYHSASGTTYEFVGKGFVQYYKTSGKRAIKDTVLRKKS